MFPKTCVAALLCCLAVWLCLPGDGAAAPARYERAKQALARLEDDPRQSRMRAPWERLAADFQDIYAKERRWRDRPAALFRSAEALDGLARRSGRRSDALNAEKRYLLLTRRHPASVLADDALYRAALLRGDVLDDEKGAARLLREQLKAYPKGGRAGDAAARLGRPVAESRQTTRRTVRQSRSTENRKNLRAASSPAAKKQDARTAKRPSADTKNLQAATSAAAKKKRLRAADRVAATKKSGPSRSRAAAEKPARKAARPAYPPFHATVKTVLLDAGHGGGDPGTAHNGILERRVTLDLAKRVGVKLAARGFKVSYTRYDNRDVSLDHRADRVRAARADLFVSIHVNAHHSPAMHGLEIYHLDFSRVSEAERRRTVDNAVRGRGPAARKKLPPERLFAVQKRETRRLARAVHRTLLGVLEKRKFSVRDGGIKTAPLYVLRRCGVPGVLVEVGYCTNKEEAARLARLDYRAALARGIADGVARYARGRGR